MAGNKNHPKNVQESKSNESKNLSFQYPTSEKNVDLDKGGQFLIFKSREKPNTVSSFAGGGGGGRSESGETSIKLFIPPGSLNYSRDFEYTPEEESSLKGIGSAVTGLVSGQKTLNQASKQAMNNLGIRGLMAAAGAVDGVGQILGSTGYAFTPNIEFYFKNQGFRTFSFTFPFLPKNPIEAANVVKIVKVFEKYSLPIIESKYLFRYPRTWDIATDGPVHFRTKECVIENFSVTYGSDNGYTTFKDGSPVMTTMKIDFKEIEMWSQEDIKMEG